MDKYVMTLKEIAPQLGYSSPCLSNYHSDVCVHVCKKKKMAHLHEPGRTWLDAAKTGTCDKCLHLALIAQIEARWCCGVPLI
jgi:hypothetical protein